MKRIQWSLVGSLVVGLAAAPAFADNQQHQQPQPGQQQQQQQPLKGDIVKTEIGLSQTPAAVRSAIEKWAAGSQIKKVEELRQGTMVQYRAEIERKGRNLQVLVNEQGQVLRAGTDVDVGNELF
jgi:hypothetical protein